MDMIRTPLAVWLVSVITQTPTIAAEPVRAITQSLTIAAERLRYYGNRHSTRDAILTVGAPAAVGAGIGAIAGGGKGAGIGALIGGGGGALFYLLNHRGRR